MSDVLISIDWDFFPARVEDQPITMPDGRTVNAHVVYDWGHTEAVSHGFEAMLWSSRFETWYQHGLDLEEHFNIDPARGSTDPDAFVAALAERFEIDRVVAADSHAHAYFAAHDAWQANEQEPLPLLHFDAHHDLGYQPDQVAELEANGQFDCATWLREAANSGFSDDITVIYPDWRGTREWERMDDLLRAQAQTVAMPTTWTDWLDATPVPQARQAADVFVCRSSAWTPPWLDARFEELLDGLANADGASVERNEDLIERAWDREQRIAAASTQLSRSSR